MRKFVLLSLCIIACIPLAFARAQEAFDPSIITNDITFVVEPKVPGPNQNVSASIEGYGLDLNTLNIAWTLNGVRIAEGRGLKNVQFKTGGVGSTSRLTVTIDAPGGDVVRSIDFAPASVDLLWQGNTYTAPFYNGRSLWGLQSRLTLVALPHVVDASGRERSPLSLIYTWSKNGEVVGTASGTGKNSFSYTDSILSLPATIRVDVSTDRDTTVGTASMTAVSGTPELLVYENNPLYGLVLNNAIGDSVTLKNKEVTFSALPFFMSPTTKSAASLKYAWTLNSSIDTQNGNKVTYRAPDGGAGASEVHIGVTNSNAILQSAEKRFLVQFGSQTSL